MGLFEGKKKEVKMMIAEERSYILDKDTPFAVREAYNALRSNITFSVLGEGCNVIAVASTLQSEGKSINTLNMAAAYADIGKKVLVVDADLRKPKVHKLLNLKASPGLSNVLVGNSVLDEAIQHIDELSLDVLCSGDIPPVSTRLLESDAVRDMFKILRGRYDYVFVDTPPINIVIDGCVIAKYTDGFIFVVKQGYALKEKIVASVKHIEFAGGKIIGFIINDVADKNIISINKYRYIRNYRYKYGRSYEEENKEEKPKKKKVRSFFGKTEKSSTKKIEPRPKQKLKQKPKQKPKPKMEEVVVTKAQ